MGCGSSREEKKAGQDLKEFAAIAADTPFDVDEVESLHELYKKLSNSVVEDGYIQKEELQFALFRSTTKRSLFLDRMFDLFDPDNNGRIEFGEFVRSLSIFHPDTPEAVKIRRKAVKPIIYPDFSFPSFKLTEEAEAELLPRPAPQQK